MNPAPEIIYHDNHLLVVNKPPLMATIGTGEGHPGLVGWAREWLRREYGKPGNVFVGVVQRLDAWVTGVIVLARTSKSAARLSGQFRSRTVEKHYWAIVEPAEDGMEWKSASGRLEHTISKDESAHRMVCGPVGSRSDRQGGEDGRETGVQFAELEYRTLATTSGMGLLEVRLITGRKHQIRAQFSALGHPVLGDLKYGAVRRFPSGIALHSQRIVVEHPTRRERLEFRASLPDSWPEWARKVGE